jgi:RNA polymerase sigma factor (sigma-70 family)
MSPFLSVRLLQTQSDERLLAAAGAGHERAFEALVQRYRKPLLRYCRRLLLPESRAEDALQQGLMQAWLALQHGTQVSDARAWLYRVVHNAAVDSLRTSGYDHEQLSEALRGADAPHSDLERRTAVRQALAGLATLPELQREALLRTAIDGYSHEEVADALGLSGGAVRGLVYRARATLRAAATAVTPAPLFVWAAGTGSAGAPLAQRLGETAAAGAGAAGATGATGALIKGGAVFLTAGALVAGAVSVHQHRGEPGGPRARGAQHSEESTVGGSSAASGARGPAAPEATVSAQRGGRPAGGARLTGGRQSVSIAGEARGAMQRPEAVGGEGGGRAPAAGNEGSRALGNVPGSSERHTREGAPTGSGANSTETSGAASGSPVGDGAPSESSAVAPSSPSSHGTEPGDGSASPMGGASDDSVDGGGAPPGSGSTGSTGTTGPTTREPRGSDSAVTGSQASRGEGGTTPDR